MATTSTALNQANILNISVLIEKITEVESEKRKLQDEITNLETKMKKRKKVDDHLTPLKERILIEQELLNDAKVECFAEVQKIEDIIKTLEKHVENVSQVYQNMKSLQTNIQELGEWRNLENNVLGGLSIIKAHDIDYTLWLPVNVQNVLQNLKKKLRRVEEGS